MCTHKSAGPTVSRKPRLLCAAAACSLSKSIPGKHKQKLKKQAKSCAWSRSKARLGASFAELHSPWATGYLVVNSKCQSPQHADFCRAASANTATPRKQSLKAIKGASIRNADDPSLLIQDSMGLVLTCANINTTEFFNHGKNQTPPRCVCWAALCICAVSQLTAVPSSGAFTPTLIITSKIEG